MTEASYRLARERLHRSYVALAIARFLSKPDMLKVLKRGGFYAKGVRLERLPREELADWIAEAFEKQPEFGAGIVERLDRSTADLKAELSATVPARFVEAIGPLDRIIENGSLAGPLWALATDPRPEAGRVLERLVRKVKRQADKFLREAEERERALSKVEPLLQGLAQVKRLEDEVMKIADRADREISRSEKKVRELREKREDQARRIAVLEEERAQLRREKAGLEKEMERLSQKLVRLSTSRPQLRDSERRIHELTKNVARLEHELGQASRLREKLGGMRGRLDEAERRSRELVAALAEAEERAEKDRFTYEAVVSDLRSEVARLRARLTKEQERRPAVHRARSYREQRVGIFLDVSNLYRSGLDYYRRQIDYPRLTQTVLNGRVQAAAIAYNVESAWGDKRSFFDMLRGLGYDVRTKDLVVRADGSRKGDWDVGIAADIIERLDRLDVVALGSGDGDFLPVVRKAKERGVPVEVYAFPNTAAALKEEADYFPIDDSMLQEEISRFARPRGARGREDLIQDVARELGQCPAFLRRLSPPELERLLEGLGSRKA